MDGLNHANLKKAFEYFEATADVGFYAYGGSLEKAYENAGLAMFNVISDTRKIRQKESRHIEVISEDLVSLLYDYLEELLFYHEVDFMLFCDFDVEIKRIDDAFNLKAKIKGESINWNKHERKTEIKAITFHMMDVKKTSHYELQAIVDL